MKRSRLKKKVFKNLFWPISKLAGAAILANEQAGAAIKASVAIVTNLSNEHIASLQNNKTKRELWFKFSQHVSYVGI